MQLRGPKLVVDEVNGRFPVISIENTARTLNQVESGSVVWLDRAAGNTVTLPASPLPGTKYEFVVDTTPTSNSHKILTNTTGGTAVLVGGVSMVDVNDASVSGFQSLESSANASLTMNATTTGGQVGTKIEVTALSAGTWFVTGLVFGSGTLATPFAATQ